MEWLSESEGVRGSEGKINSPGVYDGEGKYDSGVLKDTGWLGLGVCQFGSPNISGWAYVSLHEVVVPPSSRVVGTGWLRPLGVPMLPQNTGGTYHGGPSHLEGWAPWFQTGLVVVM
jgi:hypothetical protein